MLQTADYLLMQNSTGIQHHISNMPFGLLHPSESQTVIPLHCEKHNDVKKNIKQLSYYLDGLQGTPGHLGKLTSSSLGVAIQHERSK